MKTETKYPFNVFPELFGKVVILNDPSKTVLFWTEDKAVENKGVYWPKIYPEKIKSTQP